MHQSLPLSLLRWYKKNQRPLPFRQTTDPYAIWLAEIMLQQTTVKGMLSHYERFSKKFSSIQAVANAQENEILFLWQGLGYYSRAKNFYSACQEVQSNYAGQLPKTAQELIKLKGIGPYTAAAIASIAFKQVVPVVDGNVMRVVARLFKIKKTANDKQLVNLAQQKMQNWIPQTHPGDFNQAVMELGATICTPKKPKCGLCPIKDHCQGKSMQPELYPATKIKTYTEFHIQVCIVSQNQKIGLWPPHKNSLAKNMFELPWQKCCSQTTSIFKLRHAITNKKITAHVQKQNSLTFKSLHDVIFIPVKQLKNIGLGALSKKILVKANLLLP